MSNMFKLIVLATLASATAIQRATNSSFRKAWTNIEQDTVALPVYSGKLWSALVDKLQTNYSTELYHDAHQVDETSLNIIWLPLLDASTIGLLADMGVCNHAPKMARSPLHAPHSGVSPAESVWRHTKSVAIKSHGWVEVTHTSVGGFSSEGSFPWFYVAHGSGVSLNVGRTFVLDLSQIDNSLGCLRGRPKDRSDLGCLPEGIDVSALDSIQMIHAWDKCWDSPVGMDSPQDGFRHEIILLTTDILSEGQPLLNAVDHVHADGTGPAIKCGKWPRLFECNHEYLPLQYMDNRKYHTLCRDEWKAMFWRCDQQSMRVCEQTQTLGDTLDKMCLFGDTDSEID